MGRVGRGSRGALVVGACALLAACGFGFTGDAIDIGNASATLTGVADRTEPGDITYWFEYGSTAEYGLTTPERTVYTATGEGVTEVVDGLQPHSTYHYRICVDDDEGNGTCGEDRSFTTTSPRDTVNVLVNAQPLPGFVVGVIADVSSTWDGHDPAGSISYYQGDPGGFRAGTVSCVRVVGNRAAVGFDATSTFADDIVFYFEQQGTGGSWAIEYVDEPVSACPDPTSATLDLPANGAITIVDTP